jgi:hypothetical protein
MKLYITFMVAIIASFLITSCSCATDNSLLQGIITIGPLSPVEHPGQTTTVPCDVYDARKIMIYDQGGKNLLKQVDIKCNTAENYGEYSVELKPGIYTVDINRIGIDSSSDVPQQIEIKPGVTVKLDIDIDTGIR